MSKEEAIRGIEAILNRSNSETVQRMEADLLRLDRRSPYYSQIQMGIAQFKELSKNPQNKELSKLEDEIYFLFRSAGVEPSSSVKLVDAIIKPATDERLKNIQAILGRQTGMHSFVSKLLNWKP